MTPEATRDAIDREAPGYAEAIRADSREHTPLGLLTRGVSGVRGRTLIVNLPGNPKAIEQSLADRRADAGARGGAAGARGLGPEALVAQLLLRRLGLPELRRGPSRPAPAAPW